MQGQITTSDWEFLKQMALEQKKLLDDLQKALETDQVMEALRLARLVCGMPPETEH